MEKSSKKSKGFTLTEAILVIILIGVIAAITIPQLLVNNPTKKGWDTMADKTVGYLMQASTQILIYDAPIDDFTRLTLDGSTFSIEDSDATPKMAKLYSKYMANAKSKIDPNNEYFSSPLKDYNDSVLADSLKDVYSEFFYGNDGVIIGFRFYGGCTNAEENANPPSYRQKYSAPNSCGSIFFDINGYKKPNKLGSDQYIIPIGKRGIKYEDN